MLELLGVLWDAFIDNFTSIDYDYPDTSLSEAYANYLDTQESLYSDPPSQPSPRTTPVQQSDTPAHSQTREEFTHMAHVTYNYKGCSYSFAFEYTHSAANGYRAYIVSAPSYGRRSGNLHSTHRLRDGSRYYICWSEKITTVAPVLSNPYQVIVFDEIEKAAPRVLDILMGALDCGEIMMSKPIDGKSMIDLKHCILLFTTNLRVSDNGQKTHKKQIGFYSASEAQYASDDLSIRYRDAMVAQGMRREIAARFTDIICFQKLTGDAVVDIILREIQSCAEEYGFNISYVSPEITQSLYDEIETSGFGARMIKRAVSKRFDLFFAADPAAGSEEQFALTGSCDAPILLQNS